MDPETGKRKSSGGKGSGTPAPASAPGLDACLLCEEDSDPGAYLFALPTIDDPVSAGAIRHGTSHVGVPIDVRTRCPYRAVGGGPATSGGRHESCSLRLQVPQNGGGTSGKQQAAVHQEGAHPPVWRITRVCSVSGNCFAACEGCDMVQSDHAPQAGVAQGIFDGELVRRRVGHQVELEEEQDKEVERRVRRDAQRTTHRCACMDDME